MADKWEREKPLTSRWLGLGTEAGYRPVLEKGLMVFHDGKMPPKRCMGWLVLTPKGVEVLESLEREFNESLLRLKQNLEYANSYQSKYMLVGGITS